MPLNVGKIIELREAASLTQSGAASAAGLRSQFWSDIENGRRGNVTLSTLESMAKALGVTPCDLIEPAAPTKAKRSKVK